jgi:hypothetical protein
MDRKALSILAAWSEQICDKIFFDHAEIGTHLHLNLELLFIRQMIWTKKYSNSP